MQFFLIWYVFLILTIESFFTNNAFATPIHNSKVIDHSSYHISVSPSLNILIDKNLAAKKFKETLSMINQGLEKNPKNIDLLFRKVEVYMNLEKNKSAISTLKQIFQLSPNHAKAINLIKILEEKERQKPKNEIGFDQDSSYVNDLHAYWGYSSIHFYRFTEWGSFGSHINYAHRYGTTGKQFQIETYPLLSEQLSGSFIISYANTTQILFPNFQYRFEGYYTSSNSTQFSLGQAGQKYIRFSNQNIWTYTGSIGQYINNYFIWFRPNYAMPQSTKFYEIGVTRYFNNAATYLTFRINGGKLPDIGDLPPLDQIMVINQKGIILNGQIELQKNIYIKSGIAYNKQLFPVGLKRNITTVSLGLMWHF